MTVPSRIGPPADLAAQLAAMADQIREMEYGDLPVFGGERSAHVWGPSLDGDGTQEAERRVPPDGVMEPVDVSGDGVSGLLARLSGDRPDQLGLDGPEECLAHRVVAAVSLAALRDQDATASECGLIVDGAVQAAAIEVLDQRLPYNNLKKRKNPAAAGSGERFREGKWRRGRDRNPTFSKG